MEQNNIIEPTEYSQQYVNVTHTAGTQPIKQNNFVFSLAILLGITIYLSFTLVVTQIDEVRSGALGGEPETGWGLVYIVYFVIPLTAVNT